MEKARGRKQIVDGTAYVVSDAKGLRLQNFRRAIETFGLEIDEGRPQHAGCREKIRGSQPCIEDVRATTIGAASKER